MNVFAIWFGPDEAGAYWSVVQGTAIYVALEGDNWRAYVEGKPGFALFSTLRAAQAAAISNALQVAA